MEREKGKMFSCFGLVLWEICGKKISVLSVCAPKIERAKEFNGGKF